jgi:hypothetical protein
VTALEALVLSNILNGVEPAQAARAAALEEDRGLEIFTEAMARVREYQLVMCYPFFPVGALTEAREYRLHVMAVLGAIERWDDHEREVAIAIFKGRDVRGDGVPREDAERILNEVLKALPHYLSAAEIPAYTRDRAKFVKERRARVIEALERFPSFREPLQYKNIVTYTGGVDGLVANLRNLGGAVGADLRGADADAAHRRVHEDPVDHHRDRRGARRRLGVRRRDREVRRPHQGGRAPRPPVRHLGHRGGRALDRAEGHRPGCGHARPGEQRAHAYAGRQRGGGHKLGVATRDGSAASGTSSTSCWT